jgi:hypothetical protein
MRLLHLHKSTIFDVWAVDIVTEATRSTWEFLQILLAFRVRSESKVTFRDVKSKQVVALRCFFCVHVGRGDVDSQP